MLKHIEDAIADALSNALCRARKQLIREVKRFRWLNQFLP